MVWILEGGGGVQVIGIIGALLFLRPESFSNKLNAGADPNCNKKGGVFMFDSCTSMLEITGFQTIFYINMSSSGIFFLIWEQGWSFVYLLASLCTNTYLT